MIEEAAWEQALSLMLRTRYTPPNTNVHKFQHIERMMYEAVIELREHYAKAASGIKEELDDNGFPTSLRTPSSIILNNVTSLVSYLSAIFAFQTPPFGVTSDPAKLHVTTAVREKLTRDSFKGRWTLHLMRAIMNAVVFNYAPMRQWVDVRTKTIQMRALDPYNTVVDDSVPPEELGTRGAYAYTVEMMSLATLYGELMTFPANGITKAGKAILDNVLDVRSIPEEVLRQGNGYMHTSGYIDQVISALQASGGATDWAAFGTDQEFANLKPKRVSTMYVDGNRYAVSTYYVTALPQWLGLEPTRFGGEFNPVTGAIPTYRCLMLGPYLLAVAPESTQLNQLGISVGAVRMTASASAGGGVSATYAELLAPYQVAATKLDNARYAAIRRMLGRSGIYNGDLVDTDTLDSKHVRMKKGKDGQTVLTPQHAFLHDSVDGQALGVLIGEHGQLAQLASSTVGNTPQMRGGRTPGNKLAGEVAIEATYAEAPFRVHAMVLQETLIAALREQLKVNLALVLDDITFIDKSTGLRTKVNMQDFVDSALSFEVSDGASPASKLISPDAVGTLLSNVAQIPALQQLYDLRALFNLFATSLGVPNIDSIPTPDVAQQQLARLAQEAQGGAAVGADGAAGGIPNQANSAEAQAAADQQAAAAQAAAQPTAPAV